MEPRGLAGGIAAGFALTIADIVWILAEQRDLIARPVHSLLVGIIIGTVICSVIVQVGVRIRRQLDRPTQLVDLRYAEGFTGGASGRPAAPLRLVRDPAADR